MTQPPIYYFDNNATTRVAPEVVEAMLPFLREYWGNPSSTYAFGRQLGEHVDQARAKVAALINAEPREIIFTSCGTESNNSAIHSALATQPDKRHVLTTAVEHSANIKFCALLQKRGYTVTFLPVAPDGALDLQQLEAAIRPDTAIVSVMWANNETGILFPVREIAAICRRKGALFHTDAVQTPGKLKIDVRELDVDFLSLSAHKLHAPKGIGLLYVKRRVKYQPYVVGGGQERGRRGGTENVAEHRRLWPGGGTGDGQPAGREHPRPRAAGQVGGRHPGGHPRHLAQRRPGAAPAQHQQPRLRWRRGRRHPDVAGPGGHLRFERFGLHDRLAGPLARADGDGLQRRARPRQHPLQPGHLQHRGGGGLRAETPARHYRRSCGPTRRARTRIGRASVLREPKVLCACRAREDAAP